ncbi:MAG: hypothetical protein IJX78_07115 [Bacilli bacterium]|nr:hypothetical protein [Bacilli bacterium]
MKLIKKMSFLVLFLSLLILFNINVKSADPINEDIKIIYKYADVSVEKLTSYDINVKSVLLADYDEIAELLDPKDDIQVLPTEIIETSESAIDKGVVYEAAFAGWKLVKINDTIINENHYYPDNDFIYSNDEPFVSFDETIVSVTFEPIFGKTIYLRDKHNFNDLSRVFGDNLDVAKIDWDLEKEYAYSLAEASASDTDEIENVGSSASNPVSNIEDAMTLFGTTGGKLVTVNHYTFSADDSYYAYSSEYKNDKSKYYINFGQNITKGVLTLSGEKFGRVSGDDSEKKLEIEKNKNIDEYYENAYWYMHNTRGNGIFSNQKYISLYFYFCFYCNTKLESLNIVGYRESYNISGIRTTADAYFFSGGTNRFVMMPTIDFYKRDTIAANYGIDSNLWTHVDLNGDINSKYSEGLINGAGSYLQLNVGKNIKNNGYENIYLTLHGEKDTLSGNFDSFYHIHIAPHTSFGTSTSALKNIRLNNIHVYLDTISMGHYYGTESSQKANYEFLTNYYGIYAKNIKCNSFESGYNVRSLNIKEMDIVFDAPDVNNFSNMTDVYIGGFLNDSNQNTMIVNFINDVDVLVKGNVKIGNLYGGGNQLAVKTNLDNKLNIDIEGGSITNLYGGGKGGLLDAESVVLNLNSGTIENVFGGGAGGIVEIYYSNSPTDFTTGSYTNCKYIGNYDLFYVNYDDTIKNVVYYGQTVSINKYVIDFAGESNVFDTLNYTYLYAVNSNKKEVISNYYTNSSCVCISDAPVTVSDGIYINVDGDANITNSIYGGGKNGAVNGNSYINIKSGTIGKDVFGGGLGNRTTFYANEASSNFKFDLNLKLTSNENALTSEKFDEILLNDLNGSSQSNYAKFYNYIDNNDSAVNPTKLLTALPKRLNKTEFLNIFSDYVFEENGAKYVEIYASYIKRLGLINGDIDIKITGGTIEGSIFGGSDGEVASITGSSNVEYLGGTIKGTIYGGGNFASVSENTNVLINNTTIEEVFAGGNLGAVNGNTVLNVSGTAEVKNAYAGSNQANIGGDSTLNIEGGTITNAYGANNLSGDIKGSVKVNINGGDITNLYGGGNQADDNYTTTIVVNNGEINNLYGGGKEAAVGNVDLNINSGKITTLFGGGDQGDTLQNISIKVSSGTINTLYSGANKANIGGNVTTTILDGTILDLFGGNNASGDITGGVNVTIDNGTITNLYGGGNEAHDDYLTTITNNNGLIENLYGGGKKAAVGNVVLNINSGEITTLFGGGDQGDTLQNISIKVSSGTIGTLYSGANKANIGGNVTTTVLDGTIIDLFGGNNVSGDITGGINVTIDNGTITNLYGGGNQADDDYTSTITLNGGLINVLYGGGKEADIIKTIININGGKVETNLYGGGFAGDVADTLVNISGGEIINNLYGGGFEGDILNSIINISQGIFGGNIYGGGYAGTAETTKVQVIENSSDYGVISIAGSVFGGGEGLTASVYKTTDVLVNLNLKLIAEEVSISTEEDSPVKSGTTSTTVTFTEVYSKIAGNVYGGGDLGQVGVGFIDKNSNTATVSTSGSTKVVVENGYIGGSVFGGGSGVPAQGMIYELRMGTIYGNTETYIYGGYIANNVYGGGTQSRLYQSDSNNVTASVNIVEEDYPIVIGGSVFGGGDRGNSATTNASVPTTIGNVEVNIIGKGSGLSKIYFLNGGVYGDGNLCLVRGNRTINITDFTMAKKDELKTFYSLQRADVVNLNNSDFVLLGAIDLVEEGDLTVYSINRVNTINFINGSTIKLDQIVKYLSNITSDYEQGSINKERVYINHGYNGSNGYNEETYKESINALTSDEIVTYQQNLSETKNTICVANGLYLELKNDDINNTYGTIKGIFTLSLLKAVPGEGGGFVYASINDELGDFICETLYTDGGTEYMPIVDDVGGINNYNEFTYYVWFIQGSLINYEIGITGYIGSEQTSYEETTIIPNHNVKLDYILKQIEVEDDNPLVSAIKGGKYYLTNKKDNLLGQEIALEIRIGNTTLGYLGYESEKWGINAEIVDGENISYSFLTGYNNITEYKNNILMNDVVVDKNNNQISIILHKSTGVNAEVSGMEVSFGIELFTDSGNVYSDGTCNLNYRVGFSIVRLVPEQSVYSNTGNLFAGVGSNEIIKITSGSSFTMEYQTKYIPRAFPETGGKTMSWSLSVKGYSYFMDELGNYLTIDSNGDCISISPTLAFDINKNGVMDEGENPDKKSFVTKNNSTGIYEYSHGEKTIKMDKQNTTLSNSVIKKGTKITLIDLSNDKKPSYYYYIVKEDIVDELNLDKFMIMGTNITIGSITNKDDEKYPLFKKIYTDGDASRITERLVVIFDFEQSITSDFNGIVSLNHRYGTTTNNVDIMDYVKSKMGNSIDEISYIRSIPKSVEYEIIDSAKNDGVENIKVEFEKEEYTEEEVINLNVEVLKDANYTNTQYENGEIGIKLELADGSSLPNGIEFSFNGIKYYPKYGNKYVIIPIKNYGKYNIQVVNAFGYNSKIDKTMKFNTSLCYLPDDEFCNQTIVRAKDISSISGVCTIKRINSSAMKVTIEGRVISKTEKIVINVETKNCKSNIVTVKLGDQSYPIEISSNTGKLEMDMNLHPTIQTGSYTLEFTIDDHIEKVNIIITE